MKNVLKYFIFSLMLVLGACSSDSESDLGSITKDPNAEDEQVIELKNMLCASENGWKLTYEGEQFFFQFRADGTVLSDSELLHKETNSLYSVRLKNGMLYMKVSGGGHLSYSKYGMNDLKLFISGYSEDKIEAKGYSDGETMTFIPAIAGELSAIQAEKATTVALTETGLLQGVVRDNNDRFVSHYSIDLKENSVRFDYIENGKVIHKLESIAVDGTELKWENSVVLTGGKSIAGVTFNATNNSLDIVGENIENLKLTTNKDVVSYFDNRARQFQFSKNANVGAAHEDLWNETAWKYLKTLEINCTDAKRPLVAILQKDLGAGIDGFIFYYSGVTGGEPIVKGENDRVYFSNIQGGAMPFGGPANRLEEANNVELKTLLAAWFHADGWYLVKDVEGSTEYLYFISPTTEHWIKAKKTK